MGQTFFHNFVFLSYLKICGFLDETVVDDKNAMEKRNFAQEYDNK